MPIPERPGIWHDSSPVCRRRAVGRYPRAGRAQHDHAQRDRIDLVRDLPNDATFERDGQYYDLGYLYSTERMNGVDVAQAGKGFVLYHDDRYARLEPGDLVTISMALGEDPTTGYIPPTAATTVAHPRERMSATGDAATSGAAVPTAVPSSYRGRGSSWLYVVPLFLLVLVMRWARNGVVRAAVGAVARRPERATSAIDSRESFDARVAARLAALDTSPARPAAMPPPAARGFGRKPA